MWHERGASAGKSLALQVVSRRAVRAWVSEEIERQSVETEGKLGQQRSKQRYLAEMGSAIENRRSILSERRALQEQERETSVAAFSIVKGLLYVALSLIFIVADVVLLAEVAAGFFNINLYTTDEGEIKSIYSVAREGGLTALLGDFWHLFGLTLAVLLTGMFIKVWKDVMDNEEHSKRDARLYTFLLVVAGLALFMMAGARLSVPLGDGDQAFGLRSLVSAFLGLALPLVGAGFFTKGYDALAGRYRLLRASMHARLFDFAYWTVARRLGRTTERVEALQEERKRLKSNEYTEQELERALTEFERGYRQGVEEALQGGHLVPRLKRAAISSLLARSSKLNVLGLLLVVSVGGVLLLGCSAEAEVGAGAEEVGQRTRVKVVLFDPTSGDGSAEGRIEEVLDSAGEYLAADLRIGDRIAFFVVEQEVFDQLPAEVEVVVNEGELKRGGPEAFKARVRHELEKELGRVLAEWNSAHESSRITDPTSCILSGLERAGDYIREVGAEVDSELIILSDFLEVCREWSGALINLESGADAVEKFGAQDISLALAEVDAVTMVRLPLAETAAKMSNRERRELIDVWRELLSRSGVDEASIKVATIL